MPTPPLPLEHKSMRQRIFDLLDKNPLLTPTMLAKVMQIDYRTNCGYLRQLRHDWKMLPQSERGSVPSSVHAWRGWTVLPLSVMEFNGIAVERGWIQSKARNRWLLWVDKLGRLQWFRTGRVNIYIRKPASTARVYQLLSNAFLTTELIRDLGYLEELFRSVKFKGAHYVFEAGERLPSMTINFFQGSSGITVKVGDRSHPSSVEVLACQPDWGERSERILSEFMGLMRENVQMKAERVERMWYVG